MAQKSTFWDKIAWVYDGVELVNFGTFQALHREVREAILPGSKVLEVAAGTGRLSAVIADRADSVLCTDVSAPMLERAARRMARAGITNVECRTQDLLNLLLPPDCFDVVMAANVLHLLPNPDTAIQALLRVVRPGGRLILPVFLTGDCGRLGRFSLRLMARMGYASSHTWTRERYRCYLTEQGLHLVRYTVLPGTMPLAVAIAER